MRIATNVEMVFILMEITSAEESHRVALVSGIRILSVSLTQLRGWHSH